MVKRLVLCACVSASLLAGCGGGDDPAQPGPSDNIPAELRATGCRTGSTWCGWSAATA
ncbi:hypothetical protein KKA85_04545 [bacterium]|nr:hypothetical protein [bacterium]MBU1675030.1 hypothetical protein [bacterium]